ncbi:hypothetical protein NFI96_022043 [Prochilodus magdalenae]|nr:hypothetical protein NFI96_022043 [Prochilodus magdalenae]
MKRCPQRAPDPPPSTENTNCLACRSHPPTVRNRLQPSLHSVLSLHAFYHNSSLSPESPGFPQPPRFTPDSSGPGKLRPVSTLDFSYLIFRWTVRDDSSSAAAQCSVGSSSSPSSVDTRRCPLDAAHRTLPTGRCQQDAAYRTLPHRTLPRGWCWLDDFGWWMILSAENDPPPTSYLLCGGPVGVLTIEEQGNTVYRETDGLQSGPVHLQSVLYGSCSPASPKTAPSPAGGEDGGSGDHAGVTAPPCWSEDSPAPDLKLLPLLSEVHIAWYLLCSGEGCISKPRLLLSCLGNTSSGVTDCLVPLTLFHAKSSPCICNCTLL